MAIEIATILLGAGLGAALVLYAAPRGYFGHPRKRSSATASASSTSFAPAAEQASTQAQGAPASSTAIYETVQPATRSAPAPLSAGTIASFGASSRPRGRTYRRRTGPTARVSARNAARSSATKSSKSKKR